MTPSITKIELAQPDLGGNELRYVQECIESGWISSHGRFIADFESAFAQFAGSRFAVATNNGTTALHLALVALGIGPGDEVLVPTVTFVATANAVTYCGATPVLVDVEPGTLNIDLADARSKVTDRTKCIIPVHLYGIPADVAGLRALCAETGILMVEDAAEAHGAMVDTVPVGSFGDAAVFSFFGNKIMTTGEGGIVTTDDPELAERLRLYRGQGMDSQRRYWFPVVGYNYRMTNIQAAIGLAQLERIGELIDARRVIDLRYREALRGIGDVFELSVVPNNVVAVPWLFNVFLRDGDAELRDRVSAAMLSDGVDTRPIFRPMHQLPPYLDHGQFPVADDWSQRGITLPLHTAMSGDDVDRVVATLVRSTRDQSARAQ